MTATSPTTTTEASPSATAIDVARQRFGITALRPAQLDVIAAAEAGRDVLLVAPTGAGKSVAYWVPGLVSGGLTIVVSPLIALMTDQVARLRSSRVAAGAIHSHVDRDEQLRLMRDAAAGNLRFLYVAPERFALAGFMGMLRDLAVGRFIVDEAHCISSWGHDFRPDYRRLGDAVVACGRPPVGAFTATATAHVRQDIMSSLGLRDPLVRVTGFVRPELDLRAIRCRNDAEKHDAIRRTLGGQPDRAIIYCGRTRSADEVARRLSDSGVKTAVYHGNLDPGERQCAQANFTTGATRVIAATSAFGMGVDFPDIRHVIHFDFPGSIEAYYQEAGRAGRDGVASRCTLLFNPGDRDLQTFFIEQSYPDRAAVRAVYRELLRGQRWDTIDWEKRLPAVDRHSVRAALDVLDRGGVLLPDGDVHRLQSAPIDFDEQAGLKQHAYGRVDQIMAYGTSRRCRHRFIADYFGEPDLGHNLDERCAACDNCRRRGADGAVGGAADATAVAPSDAIAVLGCIRRFDGYLGAARITSILVGTRDSWVRQRSWVERLPSYGALRSWDAQRVRSVIDELMNDGFVERRASARPTLVLTAKGRRAETDGDIAVTLPAG